MKDHIQDNLNIKNQSDNIIVGKTARILKEQRESLDLTIKEIAVATKIKQSYIEALEESNLEKVASDVYQMGYIRTYSNFLGLDSDYITELYKTELNIGDKFIQNDLHTDIENKKFPVFKMIIYILAIIMIFTSVIYMTVRSETHHHANKMIQNKFALDLKNISNQNNEYLESNNKSIFMNNNFDYNKDEIIMISDEDNIVKIFDKQKRLIAQRQAYQGEVIFLPNEQKLFVDSKAQIKIYNTSYQSLEPQAVIQNDFDHSKSYFVKKD